MTGESGRSYHLLSTTPIAAGKYASAQDAKKALDARLAAYIASITAAPAATAPATSHPSTVPAAATAVPPPN